jgi:hypothetical protein
MSGGCSGQAAYESVRSFCLQRPSVAYVDLMATFYELSEEQLAKVLDGLVREGLIQVRGMKTRMCLASLLRFACTLGFACTPVC